MRSLYLRIYLTVVAALALFALVSGWLVQQHMEEQRVRAEGAATERVGAWAELLQRSLPPADAPAAEQLAGLREWSQRLRVPMALDDAAGRRLAASDSFVRRDLDAPEMASRLRAIRLDDGRTLWMARPNPARGPPGMRPGDMPRHWLGSPRAWPDGVGPTQTLRFETGSLTLAAPGWAEPQVQQFRERIRANGYGADFAEGRVVVTRAGSKGAL